MGPILFARNENIDHVMPCDTCMRGAHAGKLAALIIRGAPKITYGRDVCASRTIFIKIIHLTFQHPKYKIRKPECAEKDSHCHAQQEHGLFK